MAPPANIQTSLQTTTASNILPIGDQLSIVRYRTPLERPTQLPCHSEASIATRVRSKIRTQFRTTLSPTQTTGAIDSGHHEHSYVRYFDQGTQSDLIGHLYTIGRGAMLVMSRKHIPSCPLPSCPLTDHASFTFHPLHLDLTLVPRVPYVESCIHSFICDSSLAYWMCFFRNNNTI